MSGSTEKAVEKAIRYRAAFAEGRLLPGDWQSVDTLQVNPISRAVFGVTTVTFEVRARYWRVSNEG